MNIKEVKDLISEILQSDITEFELEQTGTKVKIRRGRPRIGQSVRSIPASITARVDEAPSSAPERIVPAAAPRTESADSGLHLVTSPIVGTFYLTPSPGVEPYVKIGDVVEEGVTLCIVEAMKLMNEIPSDATGTIEKIFVENGHPVEYGQPLFGIRARV